MTTGIWRKEMMRIWALTQKFIDHGYDFRFELTYIASV
jgi:hypothetical protein